MRKIWLSSNTSARRSLIASAEASSRPSGFSSATRLDGVMSPAACTPSEIAVNSPGATER